MPQIQKQIERITKYNGARPKHRIYSVNTSLITTLSNNGLAIEKALSPNFVPVCGTVSVVLYKLFQLCQQQDGCQNRRVTNVYQCSHVGTRVLPGSAWWWPSCLASTLEHTMCMDGGWLLKIGRYRYVLIDVKLLLIRSRWVLISVPSQQLEAWQFDGRLSCLVSCHAGPPPPYHGCRGL